MRNARGTEYEILPNIGDAVFPYSLYRLDPHGRRDSFYPEQLRRHNTGLLLRSLRDARAAARRLEPHRCIWDGCGE